MDVVRVQGAARNIPIAESPRTVKSAAIIRVELFRVHGRR